MTSETPSTPSTPKITAYLKTYCGWSEGVRAIMRKYQLPYEEKDIIKNPAFRWEMEQRSGQPLSPCVEVDGHMLADISGQEVEQWMIANGYLKPSDAAPDAPIDSACSDEQHEAMALGKLPVPGKIRFVD
jgi:monothiol glutaredoxin